MSFLIRFHATGLMMLAALCFPVVARADDLALRVVILANRDDSGSMQIAQHYAERRHIPEANIIALSMPVAETISWREFVTQIWEPLQSELVRARWIDAIPMKLADSVGRTKYAESGHRIAFLVTCRGVPLRIMHDPALYVPALPYTENPIFRTNAGAVDAELSLLTRLNYPINAFVPNPLFHDERPTRDELSKVVKVSRLDGPTVESAMALVDHAIEGERTGLLGRAYVDIGGKHQDGERWLEATARLLDQLGIDTDVDRLPSTISGTARFDAPVLYFGWYSGVVNGPFKLPGFRFPPGAVALHIHSYSADTLHSAEANWCGPLVALGVTATVGNVFEPYLQFTHRPDLLLRALSRGECFGDAAYYAAPVLSWQTIAIGDPLFRPFATAFETQLSELAKQPSRLSGYATVRKMNQLDASGHEADALALGRATQKQSASLAVAFAVAERLQAAGDPQGAADTLSFLPLLRGYAADELALATRGASILLAGGRKNEALEVYRVVLRAGGLPEDVRLQWLADGASVALAAQNQKQADTWTREHDRLRMDSERKKK